MMRTRSRWTIVLVLSLLAAGCGDDDGPSGTNVGGNWTGNFTTIVLSGTPVVSPIDATLTQSGAAVTGTIVNHAAEGDILGTIAGSVTGSQFHLTVTRSDGICSISGVLTVSVGQMSGNLDQGTCVPVSVVVTRR
jgi:hypothetical protein